MAKQTQQPKAKRPAEAAQSKAFDFRCDLTKEAPAGKSFTAETATQDATTKKAAHTLTLLWPDDRKHALARVVSLIARHAGARDGAAWSQVWQYVEETAAERDRLRLEMRQLGDAYEDCRKLRNELLAACKAGLSAINDELGACGEDEVNGHPTLSRHARTAKKMEAAIAKAEGNK